MTITKVSEILPVHMHPKSLYATWFGTETLLELRYCRRDHKVKGSLEQASLKADLIRKVRYVLLRSLSTRYLRRHLSIECEIQFTAKGFLVLLSCGPETITKV